MIVTVDKIIAFEGCEATLWGVGFTSQCAVEVVKDGERSTRNLIEVDDSRIVFSVPAEGAYTVSVSLDDESLEIPMIVLSRDLMPVNRFPSRGDKETSKKKDIAKFAQMLKGLLPRGFIWNFKWTSVDSEKTNWQKLLESVAAGISNVWDSLADLLVNSSPACTKAVAAWNDELGLPRKGLGFKDDVDKKKAKAEIYRIARARSGSTVPHFQNIIDLFGLNAEVVEYWDKPDRFPDWVKELGDDAYMYVMIEIHDSKIKKTFFDCNSACDEYLSFWWNENFESAIDFDKLAHVKFIYLYK